MNLIKLATITTTTNVELDMEDLSAILARGPADGSPSISGSDVVLQIFCGGVTGVVKLTEDLTGDADAARVYTDANDVDGNAVTTGALTTKDTFKQFQVKINRFVSLDTTVSAGTATVYALVD